MQFDVTWFLLTLPLAFMLGWVASRLDFRQLRLQNRRSPKAYFRGLNHLLQGKRDAAVQDFIQAVRNDPDTPELQFALGQLFRSRGEYTPAVRIHQHLLLRGDLNQTERDRAQHAIALDYTRAGILDRAEAALALLEGTEYETEARQIRLAIFERLRDWTHAVQVASSLLPKNAALYTRRLTHYCCEQAVLASDEAQALGFLERARALDAGAARPWIETAALHIKAERWAEAFACYEQLRTLGLQWLALLMSDYIRCAQRLMPMAALTEHMRALYAQQPCLDFLQAVVVVHPGAAAQAYYQQHLARSPSLAVATRWAKLQEQLGGSPLAPEVLHVMQEAEKPLWRYRCDSCGFEGEQHYWHCPGCQAWDSYPPLRIGDSAA